LPRRVRLPHFHTLPDRLMGNNKPPLAPPSPPVPSAAPPSAQNRKGSTTPRTVPLVGQKCNGTSTPRTNASKLPASDVARAQVAPSTPRTIAAKLRESLEHLSQKKKDRPVSGFGSGSSTRVPSPSSSISDSRTESTRSSVEFEEEDPFGLSPEEQERNLKEQFKENAWLEGDGVRKVHDHLVAKCGTDGLEKALTLKAQRGGESSSKGVCFTCASGRVMYVNPIASAVMIHNSQQNNASADMWLFQSEVPKISVGADVQLVLVPLVSGGHWTLLVWDRQHNECFHLNSMKGRDGDCHHSTAIKFAKVLTKNEGVQVKSLPCPTFCAQQNDLCSCGLYTAWNAFEIAQDFCDFQVRTWRFAHRVESMRLSRLAPDKVNRMRIFIHDSIARTD